MSSPDSKDYPKCMFCGITTTKSQRNLCNTCIKLGEEEFKIKNYPDSKDYTRCIECGDPPQTTLNFDGRCVGCIAYMIEDLV